jgi:hypothetical protein
MRSIEYLAGYFDGEGTIGIQKRVGSKHRSNATTSYQLTIKVANTYKPMLLEFQQRFGGHIAARGISKQFPNSRPIYDWSVTGDAARAFLVQITPYLLEKRSQAELASKLPFGQNPHTIEEKELQETIYLEVRRLKRAA